MFSTNPQKRKEIEEMIQINANEAIIKNKLDKYIESINNKCPQQRFGGLDRILRYGKNFPHILLHYQEKIKEQYMIEKDEDVKKKARQILKINNYYQDPTIKQKLLEIKKNETIKNERKLLCDLFIRVPGNNFQEKLDTLAKCKCCDRHQLYKPVKFCQYIEVNSYKPEDNPKHECNCNCRQIARQICKQYPNNFYQPFEEKRVEIFDELQIAYSAKEFEHKYGDEWYERWKLAITQSRSPPGLEEDGTFWSIYEFYQAYGNLKEWEIAMPSLQYGQDDFNKWVTNKRLREIEEVD